MTTLTTIRYEPVGTSAGATLTEVDAYESLKVCRHPIAEARVCSSTDEPRKSQVSEAEMRRSELNIASGLARSRSELFFRFISSAREVTILLLGLLSDELGLRGASRLESYHTRGESLSTMAMFKYPKHDATSSSRSGVGHNPHTDLGTFTLLLARQWGLQVLSPDTESWAFVAPRANHALINVGDSLRALSRFQFAAVVHRVFPVQEQQHEDRYSIAYFLRVNDDVELPNVVGNDDGKVCSAKAWHDYKFGVFRAPMASPQAMRDLTGGMEKDGKLIGR